MTRNRKQIVAVRTSRAPVIDGRLDDPCWEQAAQVTEFSVFADPDRLHPEQTIGRVCHDDDNLYVSLDCHVHEMDKFRVRLAEAGGEFHSARGGVVEVFVATGADRATFQQYLLHANGTTWSTLPPDDLLKILNADFLRLGTQVTDTGYAVEAAFPLAMLNFRPDTTRIWGFNLNRGHDLYEERYDLDLSNSSWNSTEGNWFATPQYFGNMVFDADLSRFYWEVGLVRTPRVGDTAVELRIRNQTGRDATGTVRVDITANSRAEPDHRCEQGVCLKAGGGQLVRLEHAVSAANVDAAYKVSLTDDRGRLCYLGGTQTLDRTPADPGPAPPPTDEQRQAGFTLFRRPYTQPVLYRAVPKAEEVVRNLAITACRGEFEPITFSIYPLRDIGSLTVSVSDLAGPQGATIRAEATDLRRVDWQSDWANVRVFEAKEHLLRRFDSLDLVKNRTQRLWLTVEVPQDIPAGDYTGMVALRSDGIETDLALTVKVLPFELSPPDDMGYFMYYMGIPCKTVANPRFFSRIAQDMRAHGMTTITIFNDAKVRDPKTGRFTLDVDNTVADNLGVSYAQMIDILHSAGLGTVAPLVECGAMYPARPNSYDTDLILQLDGIYKARNWPAVLHHVDDEIEYPERITRARKILERIKSVSPDTVTGTSIGFLGAEALGHLYDVWIGCSSAEMIQQCRSLGKKPWTYSCRRVHDVCPAFERTFFGRYAWKMGLKGISLWSYCDDMTFYDRFGRRHGYTEGFCLPSDWRHVYGHVCFEGGEVVPSVTWESVREGIDDYRYMLTLKKAAEAAGSSRISAARAAAGAGLKLLDEIANRTLIIADDVKYGRAWSKLGDMDQERADVVHAILKIHDADPAITLNDSPLL